MSAEKSEILVMERKRTVFKDFKYQGSVMEAEGAQVDKAKSLGSVDEMERYVSSHV